ncbi:MAG: hypothetical protein KJO79_10640, partial [Verrucomicrobiae bacterium]|nr:hypothetical protein [Verrucomicrobiae bacterium]NNJ87631.1 hypothetical protein [Akkermansiaceae bacterium]
ADSIQAGKSFVTPGSTTYTADGGDQASVWLSANDQSATGGVVVHVIDTSTNTKTTATKPSGSANMGNQHLVATFKIKPGKSYKVSASGVPDGSTLTVSNVSSNAVFSVVGKGFGAFAVFGVCGFLALIFGIIGLVRFFSSNDAPAPPHSPPPM